MGWNGRTVPRRHALVILGLFLTATVGALGTGAPTDAAPIPHPAKAPEPIPNPREPLRTPTCTPTCNVTTTSYGYVPAVVVVDSGANLTWTTLDAMDHTATTSRYCLDARYGTATPAWAKLQVRNGTLHVLHKGAKDWKRCVEADVLPDGSFKLETRCLFHDRFQAGVLIVRPPGGA